MKNGRFSPAIRVGTEMETLEEASLDTGGEYRVCNGRVTSRASEVKDKSLGILVRNMKMKVPEMRKRTMDD